MSSHSGVSFIIAVELSLIVDFPVRVPATIGGPPIIGGPAILRGYRGSPGNQSFTLANLPVTGEA
jgi:hypothetical protein